MLELYESTFDIKYLKEAINLTSVIEEDFSDDNDAAFFLGGNKSEKMIVRAITGYDGAIPSGNSIMAMNLLRLSKITGNTQWADRAEKLFQTFSNEIKRSPTAFSSMLTAYMFEIDSPKEIVIVGSLKNKETNQLIKRIKTKYNPSKVMLFKNTDDSLKKLSLIAPWTSTQYMINEKTTFYVCKDFACKIPTTDIIDALKFIEE